MASAVQTVKWDKTWKAIANTGSHRPVSAQINTSEPTMSIARPRLAQGSRCILALRRRTIIQGHSVTISRLLYEYYCFILYSRPGKTMLVLDQLD